MKTTKKIKPFIITAMIALIAVVVGMGGYTFAKYYTTTDTQSNQATVAKWGFVVTANATDLFGEEYVENGELDVVKTQQQNGVIVAASTGNIVAPGTKGSMTFSIEGTSEVRSMLSVYAKSDSDVVLELGADDYHPIQWTLTKDGVAVTGAENVTLAEVIEAINKLDNEDQDVAPGAQLKAAGDYVLSWKWDFDISDDVNELDTILGRIAEDPTLAQTGGTYEGSSVSVQFEITIEVEQYEEQPV